MQSLGELGVFSKIGAKPPKWMLKIMETPIKIHDLGGKKKTPLFLVQHPFGFGLLVVGSFPPETPKKLGRRYFLASDPYG